MKVFRKINGLQEINQAAPTQKGAYNGRPAFGKGKKLVQIKRVVPLHHFVVFLHHEGRKNNRSMFVDRNFPVLRLSS